MQSANGAQISNVTPLLLSSVLFAVSSAAAPAIVIVKLTSI